ncbi:MAG: protein translocase subunit SecD [Phycisphaerae bacterium]|jgi:SecD/SecF fusion protein
MNAKNLPLKFAALAILVALCLGSLFTNGLREGIDLRGGHSLIFAIRTNQSEIKRLEATQADLKAKLAAAVSPDEKKAAQDALVRTESELMRYQTAGDDTSSSLADQMIAVLKRRVDPHGLMNLEWRPVGSDRIEVRMPAAGPEVQKAKNAYLAAMDDLEQHNVHRGDIRKLFGLAAAERQAQIDSLAGNDANLKKLLAELVAANDTLQQAQKTPAAAKNDAARAKAQEDLDNAIVAYESKLDQVEQTNVNPQQLQAILTNYVSSSEEEAIGSKAEVRAMKERYERELNSLLEKHPARRGDIEKVVAAYQDWAGGRHRLEDPSDLKRLIAKAGVLEFRIAPFGPESGDKFSIPAAERDRYVEQLSKEGPEAGRRRNERLLWFPIRESRDKYARLVVGDYAGKSYVLLYNEAGNEMLHEARSGTGAWTLTDARVTQDQSGRPAVGFSFDAIGARRFGELTSNHIGHILAALLDDEVYSAPVINSTITDNGIIEGRFTRDEVSDLVSTLQAGSLPARLNPEPVAESSFGPGIGSENLKMSLEAGLWSSIIIVALMLVIYLLCGMIANVALALNILLILGSMSLLSAVFTLPGIAGVILSVGMAVDANVLIFERLREEQAKGQSIRMALKNAYERAFSAIFDSNVTTLLTCIILGWVGTEEVRGFAITLGLGVVFNIFTAVTVTRWIFQALLDGHIISKPQKMVRLIGVPRVNWMGLRYYFWAFSIATAVMGIASLAWQGSDIWGIEFSAGTKAVIQLKSDAMINGQLPNDALIRELFRKQAEKDQAKKLLDTAIVETVLDRNLAENFLKAYDVNPKDNKVTQAEFTSVGGSKEFFAELEKLAKAKGELTREQLQKVLPPTSFQISTTETSVKLIRTVVGKAFGNALEQRTRHTFVPVIGGKVPQLGIAVGGDGKTAINSKLWNSANPVYRDELADFEGGVLMVVDKITPPITRNDLLQRIREMRLQPDSAGLQFNRTEVIGLAPEGKGFSSFAVLVAPAEPASVENPTAWATFAGGELNLLSLAMAREEAMVATNFDPAIAGETAQLAIVALILAWLSIVLYLWVRFGSLRWGLAAVVCIIHDLTIVVGLVAASGWISQHAFGRALGIESFKIDLTMVAAILTLIGYSVNDTIVVFDRIRENRGKLTAINATVINSSINQTLSRTLLTGSTVVLVVLIMYIWGGPGIKGFNFALLVGILFGTYSSIAVAAPLLMGFKAALPDRFEQQAAGQ